MVSNVFGKNMISESIWQPTKPTPLKYAYVCPN